MDRTVQCIADYTVRVTQKPQAWVLRLIVLMICLATHFNTNRLEAQTCDFYEGEVSFKSKNDGNQTEKYQTTYLLIDISDNTIQYLSNSTYFENVVAGDYEIYAVNYRKSYGIVGLNKHGNLNDVESLCHDFSRPLPLRVCSVPEITEVNNNEIEVCIDIDIPTTGPDIIFEERDGDSLEIHVTILSGGDPQFDSLDVDLSAFSNAIKFYNYPTLIISADANSNDMGIAPDDARQILQSLRLTGNSDQEGRRTLSVTAVDPEGNTSNIGEVFFNAIACSDCSYIMPERSDVRFQEDCSTPYDYCLSIHKDSSHRYDILDNGSTMSAISSCAADTVVFYSYLSLASETGPFEISFWDVGDRSFKATFDDFDQLAMYMDAWDVIGQWVNNDNVFIIEGSKIRPEYGKMEVVQLATGKIWSMTANLRIERNDYISIPLTIGNHEIVVMDTILMCTDTIDIQIVCDDAVSYVPEFISLYDTVQVNQTDSLCLDQPGITVVGVYNECEPSSGEFVRFNSSQTCITFEGIEVGLDSFCIVACGPLGDCDTTTLYVNVIPEILDPVAVNDTASTVETVPVFIDVLVNDDLNQGTLQDIFILDNPDFGTVALDATNENIAEYIPRDNFCGWIDSFTYVIVNEMSQDTATVIVDITCDSLRVLNGFSPNGDGVNDVFVILGIEDIVENRVRVYNRWGNIVYSKERYRNQEGWDGTWENDHLPDGTYFYTIEDQARRVIRSGWVQIFRG